MIGLGLPDMPGNPLQPGEILTGGNVQIAYHANPNSLGLFLQHRRSLNRPQVRHTDARLLIRVRRTTGSQYTFKPVGDCASGEPKITGDSSFVAAMPGYSRLGLFDLFRGQPH
ncbi:hypothetical protein MicloDRAFT_00064940 [Microvirga lotononidis]|uniref:Uncharacterized protein n=1 Tax=Microvirga lotononidis TaxID=864069 RepID=I4YP75_9HYPH|nr:hypothetical protein MicloDRAFT_00064940 [Microvirga lotononidis]